MTMTGATNDNASGGTAREASDTVTIRNQRGLHARAAAKFVKLVAKFDAEVEVATERHGGVRPLDHGADDAGGQPGMQSLALRANGQRG